MPTTIANEKILTANDVPATVVLNRVCSGSYKPPHLRYDRAAHSPPPKKTRPVIETAITSKGATEARLLGKCRAEIWAACLSHSAYVWDRRVLMYLKRSRMRGDSSSAFTDSTLIALYDFDMSNPRTVRQASGGVQTAPQLFCIFGRGKCTGRQSACAGGPERSIALYDTRLEALPAGKYRRFHNWRSCSWLSRSCSLRRTPDRRSVQGSVLLVVREG